MRHLKIIKGDATPEEIAAVVIALSTRAAPASPASKAPQTSKSWSNHSHRMRKVLPVGQGAWRSSALPR
ncbi:MULTISPECIES: acyl-CoA carboxylase subunit epsilon [unclassified Streptosporangium]|uniref:acyl-CoA carboxylase subunit epsilon n=1 Tax=unclassified Streptosporangium TaxID=2632669 RepID=UPI002E2CCA0C|nr:MULTISPECIES: acyl-CoA carboxylase subunit epsilon [unclassified Streptosporangium]